MWLGLSLFAALLFASSGFIDKYILSKQAQNLSPAAYIIVINVAGLPVLALLYMLARNSLATYSLANMATALLAGLLLVMGQYLFFSSLNLADASLVMILAQMVVVANLILGWAVLGEHIGLAGFWGIVLILAGATALNIDFAGRRIKLNGPVLWQMCLASLAISCSDVLFKQTALNADYIGTQFFAYIAMAISGLVLLVANRSLRAQIVYFFKSKHSPIRLSVLNEITNAIAVLAVNYALILGPIALVQAATSVQVLFAVLFGLFLTKFYPHLIKENISRGHLAAKFAAAASMILGTFFLLAVQNGGSF